MKGRKIVGAALAPCVHVAGLDHFLRACEDLGWEAVSLGPAVSIDRLVESVRREAPQIVALSYRLTPDDLPPILQALETRAPSVPGVRWVFGGTGLAAEAARRFRLFEKVFDGSEPEGALGQWLAGTAGARASRRWPKDLVSRIEASWPHPIVRHHYGEPSLVATLEGARRIAESGVLDVLSIGPDQNAQEHFFRPGEMDPAQDGAGGVPLRHRNDLTALYRATRCGNQPLVRCYAGTRDLVKWAQMSVETLHNAWGAIPLCWYSEMDGRSRVPLADAIREKQSAIAWYASRGVPVEVNESHQWSLRDAHDSLAVAMAFLAAYNAKAKGVRDYVLQMMHNTPPSTAPAMDLAKMLAKMELVGSLQEGGFRVWREVRAGITSLPRDPDEAKGHMAASTIFAMTLRPHILHVVGFTEAHGVTDPGSLIASCRIARGAVRLALKGMPDPALDPRVQARKTRLVQEAQDLLEGIRRLGDSAPDPWTDADTLARAVRLGVLDTPHFRGVPGLKGEVITRCVDGGWDAIDPGTGASLSERERLARLGLES